MRTKLLRSVSRLERTVRPAAPPLVDLRNFLILEHSLALGTAIHGTPLLTALRAVLPKARLVAAASGFGMGVLEGNPHLERLLLLPSPFTDLPGAVRKLRSACPFGREPFAVLHTTGNGRTRVVLEAMLSGAHIRVGFCVHPLLMRAPLAFNPAQSQIANNLRIVEALGHGERLREILQAQPEIAEPVLYPSASDRRAIKDLLQSVGHFAVLVTQTSPTQQKSWRTERFQAIATMLWHEYGLASVFVGTAAEQAAIETMQAGLSTPSLHLAGKTTLRQMAALFERARLAISLDTGPMHIARAMRTPLVVIAPAWSPPVEWLPVANPRARILKHLELASAPAQYMIDEVSVWDVEQAARELLNLYPQT